MSVRSIARDVIPPVLFKLAKRFARCGNVFDGKYYTWSEAEAAATGYDTDIIFQQVKKASLRVLRGEALYERDSVCFYEEDYRWPVLACLLSIAAKQGGILSVLDFGGSFGSFYFQHRKFLDQLNSIHWSVVEQAHFVEAGKAEFESGGLRFYSNIEECLLKGKVDVVFLSSVLQYLEAPYDKLVELMKTEAPYFLIDRTPMLKGVDDKLVVQHVPSSIFSATLPAYILSEKKIKKIMTQYNYNPNVKFACEEPKQDDINFVGILYKKEEV